MSWAIADVASSGSSSSSASATRKGCAWAFVLFLGAVFRMEVAFEGVERMSERISWRRSVLLRREASMRSSDGEAPWLNVSETSRRICGI